MTCFAWIVLNITPFDLSLCVTWKDWLNGMMLTPRTLLFFFIVRGRESFDPSFFRQSITVPTLQKDVGVLSETHLSGFLLLLDDSLCSLHPPFCRHSVIDNGSPQQGNLLHLTGLEKGISILLLTHSEK